MSSSKLYSFHLLCLPCHVSHSVPGNRQGYYRRGGAGGWYPRKNYRKYSLEHTRTRLILSRRHPTVLRVSLSDPQSPLSARKVMISRVPMLSPLRLQNLNPSQQKLKRRHQNPGRRRRKSPNPPPPLPRSSFLPGISSLLLPSPRRLPSNAVSLSRRSRVPVPMEGSSVRMLRSSSPLRRVSAYPLPNPPPLLPNISTFL